MFLFKKVSYKTAFLILFVFFLTGFLLSLILLCFCAYTNAKSESFVIVKLLRQKSLNRIEIVQQETCLETASKCDRKKVSTIQETTENETQNTRNKKSLSTMNKRRDESMTKMTRLNFNSISNYCRKSASIQQHHTAISYPLLDLTKVEAKYLKDLHQYNSPRFTNYLRRSRKSFLGYDPK